MKLMFMHNRCVNRNRIKISYQNITDMAGKCKSQFIKESKCVELTFPQKIIAHM